jgi:hypothetical protein
MARRKRGKRPCLFKKQAVEPEHGRRLTVIIMWSARDERTALRKLATARGKESHFKRSHWHFNL